MKTKTNPREATKSAIRILIITAAAMAGMAGLMAIPNDDSATWFIDLFWSKAIAAAGLYAAWRLYERWKKIDKWLAAYDKSCNRALDTPDAIYAGKEEVSE